MVTRSPDNRDCAVLSNIIVCIIFEKYNEINYIGKSTNPSRPKKVCHFSVTIVSAQK